MALTAPKDTLAYHQSRVLTSHRDMSEVPIAQVSKAINAFLASDETPHVKPEADALWFYAMNHGMALISAQKASLEPLTKWQMEFANRYHATMGPKAVRAFYYLLVICTREARHNRWTATPEGKQAKKNEMEQLFGKDTRAFFTSINGGEATIYQALLTKPPKTTIGNFCKSLTWQFYKCSWSSGYGGKKWGAIADCLTRFVTGEYTAEMMLDTIWTLQHNGNCLFNKQIFYINEGHTLKRILDVQRSGQIPEAIRQDAQIQACTQPELKTLVAQMAKEFPEGVGHFVDWELVEALGSVNKYPKEKEEQAKKFGVSPAAKAAIEAAEKAALAAAEAEKKKLEEHAKNWFQVMPGMEVEKVQVREAA